MSVAVLTGPDVLKDKLRFEVSSKLGSSYPRFYLKGAHPVEVMRWVDALKQAIEVAKPMVTTSTPGSVQLSRQSSSPSIGPERRSFVHRHLRTSRYLPSSRHGTSEPNASGSGPEGESPQGSLFAASLTDDDNYGSNGNGSKPPYETEFDLLGQTVKAHIEMTEQLIDSITIPSPGPATSNHASPSDSISNVVNGMPRSVGLLIGSQRQVEVKQALKQSMQDLSHMVDDYISKVAQREQFYTRRYEQELAAKKLWEENMQMIVASQAEMEQELQSVARDSSRRKKQLKNLRAGLSGVALLPTGEAAEHGAEVSDETGGFSFRAS